MDLPCGKKTSSNFSKSRGNITSLLWLKDFFSPQFAPYNSPFWPPRPIKTQAQLFTTYRDKWLDNIGKKSPVDYNGITQQMSIPYSRIPPDISEDFFAMHFDF